MKGYKNLKQIEKGCKEVKSVVSGDTSFMYKCYPFICKQLVEINEKIGKVSKRKKYKPSAWNRFAGEYLRQGKTIKEAAKAWKEQKTSV